MYYIYIKIDIQAAASIIPNHQTHNLAEEYAFE